MTRRERDRADERDGRGLPVRLEPDPGDDRTDPLTAVADGKRVEADRLVDPGRALRSAGERRRGSLSSSAVARGCSTARSPAKTQTGPPTPSLRSSPSWTTSLPPTTASEESSVVGLRAGERGRAVGEPLAEEEVERGDADRECDRDGADRGEQEPRPDADPRPSHRSDVPDAVDGVDPRRAREPLSLRRSRAM